MTSTPPAPPDGISIRRPLTLADIAADAAALITEAREAGLTPPCALNCHDYRPPSASLFLADQDSPDTWQALQEWASRYGTGITTRPATSPESVYASAEFSRAGINYEVYSIIRPAPQDQAA